MQTLSSVHCLNNNICMVCIVDAVESIVFIFGFQCCTKGMTVPSPVPTKQMELNLVFAMEVGK